jgi:large subunit ribosomal protein L5
MLKLKDRYQKEVIPEMVKKFGYGSPMAAPKIVKVVINTGFGRLVVGKSGEEARKIQEGIVSDLSAICGQRAVLTLAKKSIASFKTRQGMPIGAKVTLRGSRMYNFIEKLIHVALPRSRDFRGLDAKSLDDKGNMTIAFKEYIAFPEVSPERARNIFGLEITVVTNARKREEALEFLKLLGFPIKA